MKIHRFENIDSTNNEARRLLPHLDREQVNVIISKYQSAGKGQTGNSWSSNYDENILMSIVFFQDALPASEFFHTTRFVSVAMVDFLKSKGITAHIKWPNDILVGQAKTAGILIENNIEGLFISCSIVGIGLNVNQTLFPDFDIPAISMKLATGNTFSTESLLHELIDCILCVKRKTAEETNRLYHEHLYKFSEYAFFRYNNDIFEAKLCHVATDGRIVLRQRGKTQKSYAFKEVEWIIS